MGDNGKATIRLGDLARASVPLPVEFGGATVTLEYRPYACTAAFDSVLLGDLERAAGESQFAVYDAFRRHLPTLVAGWNVTDDAGAPLPVTEETLRAIPGEICQAWYKAIRSHLAPN